MSAICPTCSGPAHLDRDLIRCDECGRAALCRCAPAVVRREPLWLERSRAKPHGLARDLTAVA